MTPQHFKFGWQTNDNLQIFAQGWQPSTPPKGVICLIHGLGEHSSRYAHVAQNFCWAKYSLLTFDHRGHGQSQGKRGHTPAYNMLLDDIIRLLNEASRRFPETPRFLYGHSMGGNLVLNYTLRRSPKLAGVIASSPWLQLAARPAKIQVKLVQLANYLWPSLTLSNGLNVNAVSRDPATVKAYQADVLNHNRVSLRLFTQVYQAGLWATEHAHNFSLPLLLTHGSGDRITSSDASRQFAANVPGNCTFKLWNGLYHEPHNEPEQQEVLAFIINWLAKQTTN